MIFLYKAKRTTTAETVAGQISAHSQEEAVELITQLGLLPVSVVAQTQVDDPTDVGRPRRVPSKEMYLFTRQLASLLKAGVSLVRALTLLSEQIPNPYFKRVVSHVQWEIKNGRSFSECLAQYPRLFEQLYVTMVRSGEESGSLPEMLVTITTYQQRQAQFARKIRLALAYPSFMAVVGIITVWFILSVVVPKMSGLFNNLGDALPIPTVILLRIGTLLHAYGIIFFGVFAALGVGFFQWLQSARGKKVTSQVLLRIPLIGELLTKAELARFCRTVTLLLRGGVSITAAFEIAIPMLDNDMIRVEMLRCRDELIAGGSLGASLQKSVVVPPLFGHLIAIGEESGSISQVLADIADTYEQEADEQVKIMTTLFEPLMIVIVGVAVGFIIFALLLPIFQMDVLVY